MTQSTVRRCLILTQRRSPGRYGPAGSGLRAAMILAVLASTASYSHGVGAQSLSSDLPSYKPRQIVTGTIRNYGFGLGGVPRRIVPVLPAIAEGPANFW